MKISEIVTAPDSGVVSTSDVLALLEYLKEHKHHVEGAMTLLISAFSIIAQNHDLTWPMVKDQVKSTFEKAKEFEIALISGSKN